MLIPHLTCLTCVALSNKESHGLQIKSHKPSYTQPQTQADEAKVSQYEKYCIFFMFTFIVFQYMNHIPNMYWYLGHLGSFEIVYCCENKEYNVIKQLYTLNGLFPDAAFGLILWEKAWISHSLTTPLLWINCFQDLTYLPQPFSCIYPTKNCD